MARAVGPILGVYVTRGKIYGWLFVSGAVLAASGLAFLYGVRECFERRASNAGRNVSLRLEPRAMDPSLVLLAAAFAYAEFSVIDATSKAFHIMFDLQIDVPHANAALS